ncbi:MAG: GrpB family protein [Ruminococcus sp.]|nr:GrpB family protein [Ruminococcus sp.]
MSIGMTRGTVYLEEHQLKWELAAEDTIQTIKRLLGDTVVDVQHIGSTSIKTIPAKPIIDIAVAVNDYEAVLQKKNVLEKEQIIFRFDERPEQLLFVIGDFEQDTRTHHIHVVLYDSKEWNDYINFRDYLNTHEHSALRYAALKRELAQKYPNDRTAYTEGKSELIAELLTHAAEWRNNRRREA